MAAFNGKVTGGGLNLRTPAGTTASSPIQLPNGMRNNTYLADLCAGLPSGIQTASTMLNTFSNSLLGEGID